MSAAVGWVVTAVGAGMVLVALRDIFATIWHPSGEGGLTRGLMVGVWRVGRRRRGRRRLGHFTGPLAMGTVVATWLALLLVGFALVYWPHLPDAFIYGSGLDPAARGGFADAMYLSAVTLATLGFGDIVPTQTWLRIVVPLEALVGFSLITAAVSWVLQVYPALTRRRSLAVRLAQLRRVGTRDILQPGSALAASLLLEIADRLAGLRADLTQYGETYYFRDGDVEASLPAMFGVAVHLAEEARSSPDSELRFAGDLLRIAVDDYLNVVDSLYLGTGGSPHEICAAYAADHGRDAATAW
jgi:voltage-gated potassium channel Kch